jgi:small ligand-binding sensory domain FIST
VPNQFAQSHLVHDDLAVAVEETSKKIRESIDGEIDLVFAFSAGYSPFEFDRCMRSIRQLTGAKHVLGCTCENVISGGLELETETAISLWAARLPGSEITPMHLTFVRSTSESAITGWPEEVSGVWPDSSSMILLGEPFAFPVDVLLERFNEDRPGVRIAGGMASGASMPGESRLLLNEETFTEGLIAIRISGVALRMLVSQGCRPIGESMVITKAERNVIESLGGRPALDMVFELFKTLPTQEQRMFQNGLHVGRVINEYQESFGFGDFLIRNVVGIDKEQRSIAIGDYVRPGQTVQFHIRDSQSASLELQQMLNTASNQRPYQSALLFTCNGRGSNLFSEPHHDAGLVSTSDKFPLAGFFAAGEIGPVGNKNFLHGFTASVVLFD